MVWQDFLNLVNSFGALIGGGAAAISVAMASSSSRKREEEKLLESLRTVALESNDSAATIDRLLNWPLFLDIERIFREKIQSYVSTCSNVDDLKKKLNEITLVTRFPRYLELSIEESKVRKDLNNELLALKKTAVQLKQSFPISGYILIICHRFLEASAETYFNKVDVHQTAVTSKEHDYFSNFEDLEPSDYAYFLGTLVSDAPMRHIKDELQPVINDIRRIIEIITTRLAEKSYETLLEQSRYEQKAAPEYVGKSDTLTSEIKSALDGIRTNFSNSDWDSIIAAHTRVENSNIMKVG